MLKKALILSCCLGTAWANVTPNSLFSDNAVLQQGAPIPVWGTGTTEGEKVEVELNGQKADTAVKDGKWQVTLPVMKASGPFTLNITAANTLAIKNVLVGEVWICSGQSNMERQLGLRPPQLPIDNWEQEAAAADFPKLRMYIVPHSAAPAPAADAKGKWFVCTPTNAVQFSAVGYFFGSELHKHLNQPVGMLFTSVGGTPVEAWTSKEALAAIPAGIAVEQTYEKTVQDYPSKLAAYKTQEPDLEKKWEADSAQAQKDNKPAPPKPSPPKDPSGSYPSRFYNAMVAPLIPYSIKGVIWYQGESNGGHGLAYRSLFPAMIQDWRHRWGQDFPFLFVQIASFKGADPMIREAQFLTLQRVPNTAMAVTTDIGDPTNIHPTHKRPVGERLALAAYNLAYGEKSEYSGPLYSNSSIHDDKVTLNFTHADSLQAKGGPLTGFTITGDGKTFVPGNALIVGNSVVVSSPAVPTPTAVRYSWAGVTEGNLTNQADLPASPFRTDVDPDPK
jgi:sialate O-acetylesterase